LPANYVQFAKTDLPKHLNPKMEIAPSVEAIMAGFPKMDHQIDAIPSKPERLARNILIEGLTENAASIATLKDGG